MLANILRVLGAGLFFGIWPQLMILSGIKGTHYSYVYCILVVMMMSPFALTASTESLRSAHWGFAVLAGIAGTIGLLSFTSLATNNAPTTFNFLFILVMVVQMIPPAAVNAYKLRTIGWLEVIGVTSAIVAITCLGIAAKRQSVKESNTTPIESISFAE